MTRNESVSKPLSRCQGDAPDRTREILSGALYADLRPQLFILISVPVHGSVSTLKV